jgi:hypothetical protein
VLNGVAGSYPGMVITVTTSQPVSIICGIFNGNTASGAYISDGTGTVLLKGVNAFSNDAGGGPVDPNIYVNPGATVTVLPMACGTW